MKLAKLCIFAIGAFFLSILFSCRTSSEVNDKKRSTGDTIAYRVAEHYFLRSNVVNLPASPISTEAEFSSLFGKATTMGEEGKPTQIDFSKEAVLAVTIPVDDHKTKIIVDRLEKQAGRTLFSYKIVKGERLGYRIKPCLILIVDRDKIGDIEFKEIVPIRKKEESRYVPTPQTGVF